MDPRTAELPELNLDRYLLVFVNDNVPGYHLCSPRGWNKCCSTLNTMLLLQLELFAQVNGLLTLSFCRHAIRNTKRAVFCTNGENTNTAMGTDCHASSTGVTVYSSYPSL